MTLLASCLRWDAKNRLDVEAVPIENGLTNKTQRVTSLPDWGSRDLKLGTIRAALQQLGLDWKAFDGK